MKAGLVTLEEEKNPEGEDAEGEGAEEGNTREEKTMMLDDEFAPIMLHRESLIPLQTEQVEVDMLVRNKEPDLS